MSSPPRARVRPGDWIEVGGLPGRPGRDGQVLEVLGHPGHERYRVRWDEVHESIFLPSEGVHVRRAVCAADPRPRCGPRIAALRRHG